MIKKAPRTRFGEFVKQQRLNRGMTQDDFAYLLGVKQPWVSVIERGSHSPTVKTIERIFDALEIPREDFYDFLDS